MLNRYTLLDRKPPESTKRNTVLLYARRESQIVALKCHAVNLQTLLGNTFFGELAYLSSLDHPNILKPTQCFFVDRESKDPGIRNALHHLFTLHNQLFVIETPLAQQDLFDFLAKTDDCKNLATYAKQMIEGVHYLHEQGWIHGDIKPENMVLFGTELKITDFGGLSHVTHPSRSLTTPYYQAPELLKAVGSTQSGDLWSLGVTLFTLFTRQAVPWADTQLGVIIKTLGYPGDKWMARYGTPALRKQTLVPILRSYALPWASFRYFYHVIITPGVDWKAPAGFNTELAKCKLPRFWTNCQHSASDLKPLFLTIPLFWHKIIRGLLDFYPDKRLSTGLLLVSLSSTDLIYEYNTLYGSEREAWTKVILSAKKIEAAYTLASQEGSNQVKVNTVQHNKVQSQVFLYLALLMHGSKPMVPQEGVVQGSTHVLSTLGFNLSPFFV